MPNAGHTTSDGLPGRRASSTRPASGRPTGRRSEPRGLYAVLTELARTRSSYEDLRVADGSLSERALLVSALHELRAEAAELRLEVA